MNTLEFCEQNPHDAACHIDKLELENERLKLSAKRDDILTAAMAEIYATLQGRSTQPIQKIVDGCRAELCKL